MRKTNMFKKTLAATLALAMTVVPIPYGTQTKAAASAKSAFSETITFEDKDAAQILNQNTALNGSVIEEVVIDVQTGAKSKVLTFGQVDAAEGVGVQIDNPFKGHTEMNETLAEALKNSGIPLAEDLKACMYERTPDVTNPETGEVTPGYWQFGAYHWEDKDKITSVPTTVYKKGATISAWVKLPSGTREDMPIISFRRMPTIADGTGGLYITANGSVGYLGDYQKLYRDNLAYVVSEDNTTPTALDRAGQWVYVTTVIKNNEFEVYFDGKKVDLTYKGLHLLEKKYCKKTNYGYRAAGMSPLELEDMWNNTRDLFKGLSDAEVEAIVKAGVYDDFDRIAENSLNNEAYSIMEWLAKDDVELYIGGCPISRETILVHGSDDKNNSAEMLAAGTQMDDITFTAAALTEEEAAAAYQAAVPHRIDAVIITPPPATPTPTPRPKPTLKPADPSAGPVTEEPYISETVTFEDADQAQIISQNAEVNSSVLEETVINSATGEKGKVLTFGTVDEKNAAGVQIVNPFKGHTEMNETLAEALKNTGSPLAGDIGACMYERTPDVTNSETGKVTPGYWQFGAFHWGDKDKITSVPATVYRKGATISAWVKVPEGTMTNTPILSFMRKPARGDGAGGLYITADGSVGYLGNYKKEYRDNLAYVVSKENKTPTVLDKAGQWVYVTTVIRNNEIEMYVDGEKLDLTFNGLDLLEKKYCKKLNYGYRAAGMSPLDLEDMWNNTRDLFMGVSDEEVEAIIKAGVYDDFDRIAANSLNNDAFSIMEWLAKDDVELYVGGCPMGRNAILIHGSKNEDDTSAKTLAAGMQVDDITFTTEAMSDENVAEAYKAANLHITGVAPTEIPATPTPEPETETPATPTPTPEVPQKTYFYGDIDQNGKVEAIDALAILKHVVKLEMITDEIAAELADVDHDKAIMAKDALGVLKVVVKLSKTEEYTVFAK